MFEYLLSGPVCSRNVVWRSAPATPRCSFKKTATFVTHLFQPCSVLPEWHPQAAATRLFRRQRWGKRSPNEPSTIKQQRSVPRNVRVQAPIRVRSNRQVTKSTERARTDSKNGLRQGAITVWRTGTQDHMEPWCRRSSARHRARRFVEPGSDQRSGAGLGITAFRNAGGRNPRLRVRTQECGVPFGKVFATLQPAVWRPTETVVPTRMPAMHDTNRVLVIIPNVPGPRRKQESPPGRRRQQPQAPCCKVRRLANPENSVIHAAGSVRSVTVDIDAAIL